MNLAPYFTLLMYHLISYLILCKAGGSGNEKMDCAENSARRKRIIISLIGVINFLNHHAYDAYKQILIPQT